MAPRPRMPTLPPVSSLTALAFSPCITPRSSVTLPVGKAGGDKVATWAGAVVRAPFVEGEDAHYGLDGFESKLGAIFRGVHPFNKEPANVAKTQLPLRLFVFGDWGTGLPLAKEVTGVSR